MFPKLWSTDPWGPVREALTGGPREIIVFF